MVGGLRGALALALALSLPADLPLRDDILISAFAVVAFSVIVQGLTAPLALKALGAARASRQSKALDALTSEAATAKRARPDEHFQANRTWPSGPMPPADLAEEKCLRRAVHARRNPMKPTPRKPRIIIAHVEGSGAALAVVVTSIPLGLARSQNRDHLRDHYKA